MMAKQLKNTQPLVSVIIPAYNAEQYIEDAVRSITNQTYHNLEIIVVDDGSSDKTAVVVNKIASEDKRVKLVQNEVNLKIVGTLNKAIDIARGEYIARMDADDFKEPDGIQRQVEFLNANEDVAIVGGAILVCDSDMNVLNKREYPTTDGEIRARIFRYSPFAHPAVMYRASAVKNNKYELNWAEDYDLYFRLGMHGQFANLAEPVLRLRTHKASVSQSKASYQEYLTLYIRLKAVFEYGYVMKTSDKWYFAAQLMSKFLMPAGFRFWLFNKIRSFRK